MGLLNGAPTFLGNSGSILYCLFFFFFLKMLLAFVFGENLCMVEEL